MVEIQNAEEKYDETLELQLYGLSPDLDLWNRRMTQFLEFSVFRAHYQNAALIDLNSIK